MRRGLTFVALALLLTACAGAQGPSQAVPIDSVSPALGLDDAGARQAVRDFVQAYANAPQDGGAGLASLADGALMFRWVHWLEIQNEVFPGTIVGHAQVSSMGALHTFPESAFPGTTNPVSGLLLSASVTFDYAPAQGAPFRRTVSLNGPILVQSVASGRWHVLAFTRDGSNLEEFLTPVDASQTTAGVEVTFDTLITSSDQWLIGVTIANRSTTDVQPIDGALTDPNGNILSRVGFVAPSSITPGNQASALVSFPAPAITGELDVAVRLRIGDAEHVFPVPFSRLLRSALTASPSPTPSGSATPVPSPS